ncbi:CHAP domain-containing protein [Homoserinibacter sp. GY 40078]|uniref:CHAP domain-containing protein n=1 Tax=Homoserinibacter sp. GY 40078 TaxID=2603275 RepID=UPI0011CB0A1C|nr:CHAP domain-containing protein [Homoserinibacter sp. GY 40078]TXK19372.1 CHAP domain-containing protein [Homoserinibacter sp. GY 40078]
MTDNETLAASVEGAPTNVEYPSRRSLRIAREAAEREAQLGGAGQVAAVQVSPASAVPIAPAVPAPAVQVSPVSAVPVVAPPAPLPTVAAPFSTFQQPTPPPAAARRSASSPRAPRSAAVASGSSKRPVRQRLTAAGTMVLVGGLFASLTLPAYASNDYAGTLDDAAPVSAQVLALDESEVDAKSVAGDERDDYSATSATDLRRLYQDAVRQQNLEAYVASGAKEMGDDYPWAAELTRGQGGGLSPLNYFYRECVDFVAWRLNRDAGSTSAPFKWTWSTLTPGSGSAYSWKRQWEKHGWPISNEPSPGWVAWFPGQNHVAYVSGVLDDGSVVVEEYNWGPNIYGQRIIQPSDAIYLSPPPA